MKKVCCFIISCLIGIVSISQLRQINPEEFQKADLRHSEFTFSNSGKYLITIRSGKINSELEIRELATGRKRIFENGKSGFFVDNERFYVRRLPGDSLQIINTENFNPIVYQGVRDFSVPNGDDRSWIACLSADSSKVLSLVEVRSQKVLTSLRNVADFVLSPNGSSIAVQASADSENFEIIFLNTVNHTSSVIAKDSMKAESLVFDPAGKQLVFFTRTSRAKNAGYQLNYYSNEDERRKKILKDSMSVDGKFLHITPTSQLPKFNADGTVLFFQVRPPETPVSKSGSPVNIWRAESEDLQAFQLLNLEDNRFRERIIMFWKIPENKFLPLTQPGDAYMYSNFEKFSHRPVMVSTHDGYWETWWRQETRNSIYAVSLEDGFRKLLVKNLLGEAWQSPTGKYILWYDRIKCSYYAYNTERATSINISAKIKEPLFRNEDLPVHKNAVGHAGWLDDDRHVLVYGRNDIWKLDMNGTNPPVNVTKGDGHPSDKLFRLIPLDPLGNTPNYPSRGKILLSAFNLKNKNNGFYMVDLSSGQMDSLTMGPYIYSRGVVDAMVDVDDLGLAPIQSAGQKYFVIHRSSEKEFRNSFLTTDFKNFETLTDNNPNAGMNWYTSELIHFTTAKGKHADAIVYKPDNFDPNKTYPVIFHIYEKVSDRLHRFIAPEYSSGNLDIYRYVNNGYVVVEPDIYYEVGSAAESALEFVTAAAKKIKDQRWADAKKFGLQGHSYGAYETNYIITRSNLFTAACSSAGVSDKVSSYLGIRPGQGVSGQVHAENGQGRMGAMLWHRPEIYLKSSPVLYLNKVQTPLLIMHNQKDFAVSFEQGIELFTGLRRLQKKVWMLSYDNEGHTLENEVNRKDFSIRMGQFFDYYLKGAPAPTWMTQGVPASKKGVESRLELDIKSIKETK